MKSNEELKKIYQRWVDKIIYTLVDEDPYWDSLIEDGEITMEDYYCMVDNFIVKVEQQEK